MRGVAGGSGGQPGAAQHSTMPPRTARRLPPAGCLSPASSLRRLLPPGRAKPAPACTPSRQPAGRTTSQPSPARTCTPAGRAEVAVEVGHATLHVQGPATDAGRRATHATTPRPGASSCPAGRVRCAPSERRAGASSRAQTARKRWRQAAGGGHALGSLAHNVRLRPQSQPWQEGQGLEAPDHLHGKPPASRHRTCCRTASWGASDKA